MVAAVPVQVIVTVLAVVSAVVTGARKIATVFPFVLLICASLV